jgi:glycosyltransferase involved in cell wall biosynthesis
MIDGKTLTLFFSKGVSLKTWEDTGLLGREAEIYRRLGQRLGKINFVTYGDQSDLPIAAKLDDCIEALSNAHPLLRKASYLVPEVLLAQHWGAISKSDILKTNQITAAALALRVKKRTGQKMIARCGYLWSYMAEQDGADERYMRKVARLEGNAFVGADMGVVTTDKIRDMVLDRYPVPDDRIRVIPNYVNTDVFRPAPEVVREKGQIVFIGRFEYQKNLNALIEAVALVNAADNGLADSRLLMVGEGSEQGALARLAAQRGVEVEFSPRIPNQELPAIINRAQVYALVSRFEGHAKTLLEAMACGSAVIGTKTTGIVEEIQHMENGYLCDLDAQSIAHGLAELLANEKLCEKMGQKARSWVVDRYSVDRVLAMEIDVIERLLG